MPAGPPSISAVSPRHCSARQWRRATASGSTGNVAIYSTPDFLNGPLTISATSVQHRCGVKSSWVYQLMMTAIKVANLTMS